MSLQCLFDRGRRTLSRWGSWLLEGALALGFPRFCRSCGEGLTSAAVLCPECQRSVRWIGSAGCARCGLPQSGIAGSAPGNAGEADCAACRGRDLALAGVLAAARHEGAWRHLVLLHKFQGDREVRRSLVAALAPLAARRWGTVAGAPPILVPLPAHFLRRLSRRRDAVAELAGDLARELGWPIAPILRRSRWRAPQTRLGRDERLRSPYGSFALRAKVPAERTLILVDDVATTLGTVDAAARVLVRGGAVTVQACVLSRSEG